MVKTVLPMQGAWVQSLEGERSHMPLGMEKKNFFQLKKKKLKLLISKVPERKPRPHNTDGWE